MRRRSTEAPTTGPPDPMERTQPTEAVCCCVTRAGRTIRICCAIHGEFFVVPAGEITRARRGEPLDLR